jgi:hypothetical protein
MNQESTAEITKNKVIQLANTAIELIAQRRKQLFEEEIALRTEPKVKWYHKFFKVKQLTREKAIQEMKNRDCTRREWCVANELHQIKKLLNAASVTTSECMTLTVSDLNTLVCFSKTKE